MSTESQKKASRKYNQNKTVSKSVMLNKLTDADIIEYINKTEEPFNTMVKRLIRKEANK